jgi:signal transduction histidine kinase
MKLTPPTSSLERFVLGLGVASSACLAIAAFAAFGNSREAGWRHLNDIAGRARESVRTAWSTLTADTSTPDGRSAFIEPASDVIRWSRQDASEPPAPLEVTHPAPRTSLSVFDALFSESARAEIARGDLAEALSLAEESLVKEADAASLAQARLRAIQLAAKLGRGDTVLAHWRHAYRDVDPRIVTGDTSTLLLSLLAALPFLDRKAHDAEIGNVLRLWSAGELPVPGFAARFERFERDGRTWLDCAPDARESALRERLVEDGGRPENADASFRAYDARRRREALRELVGTLLSNPEEGRWNLLPAGGDLLAVRAFHPNVIHGYFVLRPSLVDAFRSVLDAQHALPAGFQIDMTGDRPALGEPVGASIDLGPAFPRVVLRHADVPGLMREAESRTLWLRGGLLVLALFVMGASVTTAFALRRERRLVEARTSFVAGVSHELRTPLTSILLMAENLENGRAGPNLERYHASIRREALRLRRLVDDVLDFSRLERGKRFEARIEDVDPGAWFDAVAAEAIALATGYGKQDSARGSVEISSTRGPLPDHGSFDREALRRAVLNLVDNALKHSGASSVRLHAEAREGMLALSVSDDGKGIPARHRDAVFDPFTRLTGAETTPGAGLGLAIVREIAVAHGGHATVASPQDSPGVVVEIVIPLGASAPTRVETTS